MLDTFLHRRDRPRTAQEADQCARSTSSRRFQCTGELVETHVWVEQPAARPPASLHTAPIDPRAGDSVSVRLQAWKNKRLEYEMVFWSEATEPSQVYHRNEQLSYICKTPKITIRVDRGRRWRLFRSRFFYRTARRGATLVATSKWRVRCP